MTPIFIVRHGEDEDNAKGILNGWRDKDLTELGRTQAKKLAKKLVDHSPQAIYSSPLARAYQTAEIIARECGIKNIKVEKQLIERNFGVLTGRPVVDIEKYTDKIFRGDKVNYFLEAEGAESFSQLYQRAKLILQKIQREHPTQKVLVITHGDFGKMMQAAFYGWDWNKGLTTPYFENTQVLTLSRD